MGPQLHEYSFSINKKEKKLAIKYALSEKNQKDEIIIVDSLKLNSHKTKELVNSLNKFKFNSALFVYDSDKLDKNFKRASANIHILSLLSQDGINVQDLIHHDQHQ